MTRAVHPALLISCWFTFYPPCVGGEAIKSWRWINPLPSQLVFHAVAYGNGRFVAVGEQGAVLLSDDGENWSLEETGRIQNLQAVAFGEEQFVAGGEDGLLLISENGRQWGRVFAPTIQTIRKISYGDGIFVAVGHPSTILSSSDGTNWIQRASGSHELNAVCHGNGIHLAAGTAANLPGWERPAVIFLSTNGSDWETIPNFIRRGIRSASFLNGEFFLGTEDGQVYRSPDGREWTWSGAAAWIYPINAMVYGSARFALLQGLYTATTWIALAEIMNSTNGRDWSPVTLGYPGAWLDAVYGGGRFVAVGAPDWQTGMPALITSLDGVNWRHLGERRLPPAQQVYFDGSQFVTLSVQWGETAEENRFTIATSPDGIKWAAWEVDWRQLPSRLEFFKGSWIAIGQGLSHSPDGKVWTTIFEDREFLAAAKDDNQIMIGGRRGGIMVSPDGLNWEERSTGVENAITSLTKHGEAWVALAETQLLVSTDGMAWSIQESPVAWGFLESAAGILLAANSNEVFFSSDGLQWERSSLPAPVSQITFTGTRFLAVGGRFGGFGSSGQGIVLESIDGAAWQIAATPATGYLSQIAWGKGTALLLTGRGGIVQLNPPGAAPTLQMNDSLVLLLSGRPGGHYRIETTEDLNGTWREDRIVTLGGSSELLPPINPLARQAFFRAVLLSE
jgi:hypothetical protein